MVRARVAGRVTGGVSEAVSEADPGARRASLSWLREPMAIGIVVSVAFHLTMLAVRFVPPTTAAAQADARLEVVLLNARTARAPVAPDVAAQANLEAGGDRERGRVTSPLPASERSEDGEVLAVQQRRARALLAQQRRLLLSAQGPRASAAPDPSTSEAASSGADAADADRAISRLQAQIDQELADGQTLPRRRIYGVNAVGTTYARYVDAWARRVERIGTEQYPDQARGRLYDAMLVTVEIDQTGHVVDIVVHNRSRHDVFNQAVRRIVLSGAPYPRFTPEMAREGETLRIVRVWNFTNDALATRAGDSR